MNKIKTKEDAKYFLDNFKQFAKQDDYGGLGFDFHNSTLSFGGHSGGTTRIEKKKDGWTILSWGKGWNEPNPSYIEEPENYVFEHKKDINRWI